ncbi:MAG TPA: HAMP domain-containing sensor histidine kinase [Jatrophihabitans sp.]|jgi:two-component system sensor histidine kinase MprB
MTLRSRVAVAAGAGVFLVLAVVNSVLYLFYVASLHSRVDASLVDVAQQTSAIASQLKQAASDKGAAPDITKPVTVGSTDIELLPGPVGAGQPTQFGPLSSRDIAVANHSQTAYFATIGRGGQRYRVYTAAMPDTSAGAIVRTSRAESADDGAMYRAAALLLGLTVAASATVFGVARLTAARLLRPIADLTAAAEHITRTRDLGARLAVADSPDAANPPTDRRPKRPDEVGRLSASIDSMLAELERSSDLQRQLVADASHELRTPLTSLTTNLELLADGDGLADQQAPALVRAARESAGELNSLMADILDLARYGESPPHREDVRLDLLAAEVVRRATNRATEVRFQTSLHPVLVCLDPAAADRAVSNLLDNAVKWSPPGGVVLVEVASGAVRVSDQGPGIGDADLPHVFERFYRSAAARGSPGAGLGLAIVARVTEANGGVVAVQTGPNGSTFSLSFPDLSIDQPTSGASAQ